MFKSTLHNVSDLHTQKARGIYALTLTSGLYKPFDCTGVESLVTMRSRGEVRFFPLEEPFFPCFVRPCPSTPRHGFLESRRVVDRGTLDAIYKEACALDPKAELVLMSNINGFASAVVTNAGVVWGVGTNGVTRGERSWVIPSPSSPWAYVKSVEDGVSYFKDAVASLEQLNNGETVINENTIPYLEVVATCACSTILQVRPGPAVTTQRDLIFRRTIARVILRPNLAMSLLRFEKLLVRHRHDMGVVINTPGGSLASHFAVQGALSGVSVVTSRVVQEGDMLVPSKAKAPLIRPPLDKCKFLASAIGYFLGTDLTKDRHFHREVSSSNSWASETNRFQTAELRIRVMASSLHSSASWGWEEHLMFLRAHAVAVAIRFGASACIGEARHFHRSGPGRLDNGAEPCTNPGHYKMKMADSVATLRTLDKADLEEATTKAFRQPCLPWHLVLSATFDTASFYCNGQDRPERSEVYNDVMEAKVPDLWTALCGASVDLMPPGWVGDGFGGAKWASSSSSVLRLMKATHNFCNTPLPRRWTDVWSAVNGVVESAHNNGFLLNKWVSNKVLEMASVNPWRGLLSPLVAGMCLDAGQFRESQMLRSYASVGSPADVRRFNDRLQERLYKKFAAKDREQEGKPSEEDEELLYTDDDEPGEPEDEDAGVDLTGVPDAEITVPPPPPDGDAISKPMAKAVDAAIEGAVEEAKGALAAPTIKDVLGDFFETKDKNVAVPTALEDTDTPVTPPHAETVGTKGLATLVTNAISKEAADPNAAPITEMLVEAASVPDAGSTPEKEGD